MQRGKELGRRRRRLARFEVEPADRAGDASGKLAIGKP
jgi:hypothetical protein